MFHIGKRFAFDASHQLLGLPEGHKCGRLHGHTYHVDVQLAGGALDRHGFVVDYGDLKAVKNYIDDVLDHRHLNDVMGLEQPTAENLARFLFERFQPMLAPLLADDAYLESVTVAETPNTWATYRP